MAKGDVVLNDTYYDVGGSKAAKVGSKAYNDATKRSKIGNRGQAVSQAVAKKYGLGPKPVTKAVGPSEDK